MIRIIKLSTITAIALVSIIGCGGDSSSNGSLPDTKTGKGYYIDKAVKGIDYVCGNQKDKTGDRGAFIFEEGKECIFTLAGIQLRTIKADELVDGREFPENNITVATFLQSIDADGNPDNDNDIEITDKVLTAVKTILEKNPESKGKIPEGSVLEEVVDKVVEETGVDRNVRENEEVEAHLAQSQTEIIKKLLAGKTLYTNIDDKMGTLESWVVNNDATSLTWKELIGGVESDTATLKIKGMNITVTDSEETAVITVKEIKKDYLLLEMNHIQGRVYFDEAKAKAYFLNNGTTDLKTLLAGKTLYTNIDDKMGTLESWTFDASFSQITWQELIGGTDTDISKISDIDGSSFVVTDEDSSAKLTILEKHDDYVLVQIDMIYDEDGKSNETSTGKAYFDIEKARASFGVAKVTLVPTKTISSSNDWNSVSPIYTDTKGDTALSSLDITAIKMAQDSENLYINLKRAGLNFPSSDYYYNYWIYFKAGDKTFSLENFHDNQGGYWFRIYKGIGYQGGTLVVDKMKTANITDLNLQLVVPKSLNLIGKDISYTVSLFTHGFKDKDGKRDIEGEKEADSNFLIKF